MDLLTLCGDFEPVGKVDALADWLDDNAEGAWESDYYRDLEPPYAAANRMLFSWSELLAVRGFSREMLARSPAIRSAAPFRPTCMEQVTVLPIERDSLVPVNLNTVGPDVLRGLLGMQSGSTGQPDPDPPGSRPAASAEPVLAMLDPGPPPGRESLPGRAQPVSSASTCGRMPRRSPRGSRCWPAGILTVGWKSSSGGRGGRWDEPRRIIPDTDCLAADLSGNRLRVVRSQHARRALNHAAVFEAELDEAESVRARLAEWAGAAPPSASCGRPACPFMKASLDGSRRRWPRRPRRAKSCPRCSTSSFPSRSRNAFISFP